MSAAATHSIGRDVRVIGLISVVHGFSHFFQLVLPPLFPLLKQDLGVSYAELGAMMTLFYVVSGLSQAAAGFVVDRVGAPRVLMLGMGIFAGAIALASLALNFYFLMAIMALAGIGNSVFHPADFAIINASVAEHRLGRAYSAHGICGNIGWALAPITSYALSVQFGWRNALLILGVSGVLMVVLLLTQRNLLHDHRNSRAAKRGLPDGSSDVSILFSSPVLMCFAYFAFLAMSLIGLQNFAVSAIEALYSTPHAIAAAALTAFLLGSTLGVVAGGFLADATKRHDLVATGGILAAALLTLLIASAVPSEPAIMPLLGAAGFCLGATSPSRDLLVRAATPVGASGKVYGFVYSGLDLGSAITPVVFGILLDLGSPQSVFLLVSAIMLTSILTVLQVGRHALKPAQA